MIDQNIFECGYQVRLRAEHCKSNQVRVQLHTERSSSCANHHSIQLLLSSEVFQQLGGVL